MFRVEDFVVYKKDVCKIKDIREKNGTSYYVLVPIDDTSLTITVTMDNEFLRGIVSCEEAMKIIEDIPNVDIIESQDRLIEAEYKKLLHSGSHYDLIKIIKTTYLRNDLRHQAGKKLGDKDKDYFEKAERYLYNELSLSLRMSFFECREYIINKVTELVGQ